MGYRKKAEKEIRAFASLRSDLSTMPTKLEKDNLIARIQTKPRTFVSTGLNPHIHCYYLMDVFGHKTEDCWALKYKIKDNRWGSIYNWLGKSRYVINDRRKAHHASQPNPSQYSPASPFIIENWDWITRKLKARKISTHMSPRSLNKRSPSSCQSSS